MKKKIPEPPKKIIAELTKQDLKVIVQGLNMEIGDRSDLLIWLTKAELIPLRNYLDNLLKNFPE